MDTPQQRQEQHNSGQENVERTTSKFEKQERKRARRKEVEKSDGLIHASVGDWQDKEGVTWKQITEGEAKIIYVPPKLGEEAFYNPVQELNRDFSILVIKSFLKLPTLTRAERRGKRNNSLMTVDGKEGRGASDLTVALPSSNSAQAEATSSAAPNSSNKKRIKILEGLSATGLRSIRYFKEIGDDHIESILVNDYDSAAVETIKRNIVHNGLSEARLIPHLGDAATVMHLHKDIEKRFDVVDVDPYGGASKFLDSAVQAVADGGLLNVTCTDSAVLCGTHSESCFSKYGSISLKGSHCHEMSLRIILASIDRHANRYGRYIVPLFSLSVDFYIRVFVRVFTSPKEVQRSPSKQAYVFKCVGCHSFHLQPVGKSFEQENQRRYLPGTGPPVDRNCAQCGRNFQVGGPIWAEKIHDKEFLEAMLVDLEKNISAYGTGTRMRGLLTVASEELPNPLFLTIPELCNVLHIGVPAFAQIRSAFLNAGYNTSISHTEPNAIKTNAPMEFVWDVMRAHVKLHPVPPRPSTSPAAAILAKEPKCVVDFKLHADAVKKPKDVVRFEVTPDFWGPKSRAGGKRKK